MFKRVAGTRDILPDEVNLWQNIESISRKIFKLYGFAEIRPPLIEDVTLFNRSLGEATEIVQKQMFLIKKEDETFVLRPEATASVVRAYVENNLDKINGFLKLYYMGPMFRMERPQKGRLRQFHQIGCEAIGSYGPQIDVEVIALADRLLKALNIKGYKIVINSLGCADDKKNLNEALRNGLSGKLESLCLDCKDRFNRNILRILDCKNDSCQQVVKSLNLADSFLCGDCTNHFNFVKDGLNSLGIEYQVSSSLVRGLDYYNRTVFEIKHHNLGTQQDALGAGGRYDGLVGEIGGNSSGAIGFAFGFERLLLAMEESLVESADLNRIYLIALGDNAKKQSIAILDNLRSNNICAETDYENRSIKSAMRRANDLKSKFVIMVGDDELKDSCATVKNMSDSSQEKVSLDNLVNYLKNKLGI